jgi:hypothetical protein
MNKLVIAIALLLSVTGCKGQKRTTSNNNTMASDSANKPKVDIKVNKKYDSKGNLVQYDSTYTYFYQSPALGSRQIHSDSLLSEMKQMFHTRYDSFFLGHLNDIFFRDTLLKYDFLNSDYFSKRFEMNKPLFNDLFRDMDSMKSEMLKRTYPKGELKRNNKPKD